LRAGRSTATRLTATRFNAADNAAEASRLIRVAAWARRWVGPTSKSFSGRTGRAARAQARLAAIPAPINMLNLQAPGFARTMWARMVQAERHARGCADFAYALKHARAMPAFSWTTVALCLKVRGGDAKGLRRRGLAAQR